MADEVQRKQSDPVPTSPSTKVESSCTCCAIVFLALGLVILSLATFVLPLSRDKVRLTLANNLQLTEHRLRKRVKVDAMGFCVVKIHGDTTGNCKTLPMNQWIADHKWGGTLGKTATLSTCRMRRWESWCGSEVEYKIEAAGYCLVKVNSDSTGRCKNIQKLEWFRDYLKQGNLGADGHITACYRRTWAHRCGPNVEYKLEAAFSMGDRVMSKKPLAYPPSTIPNKTLGTVVAIEPKLGVEWDLFEELQNGEVYSDQIELIKET